MAVNLGRSMKRKVIVKVPSLLAACKAFSAGGKTKKVSKGVAGDAAK